MLGVAEDGSLLNIYDYDLVQRREITKRQIPRQQAEDIVVFPIVWL